MKKLITLGCLATVFTMGYAGKAKAQDDSPAPDQGNGDRKVRIEITTKENGSTERVTHEFDIRDEQALEDALRELGVFDEIGVLNDGENLVIDLKRLNEEGSMLKDMCMALSTDPEWEGTGAFLGVYGGNWNTGECGDKDNKNNKVVKEGACITSVIDDTPAAKAGLEEGDVITMVDDSKVTSFGELAEQIGAHQPGDEVQLTYYRDGKKQTMTVTLAEQEAKERTMFFEAPEGGTWSIPDMEDFDWESLADGNWSTEPQPFLGVDGEDAEGGGARITEVIEGTSAESMGIEEGDVIRTFNGVNVLGFDPLAEMIGEMEPGASVEIEIERDGERSTLHGVLGEQDMPTWVAPPPPHTPPGAPAPYTFMYRMPRMDEGERDEMRREMDELRQEMDRLRRDLRGEVTREMRVVVTTIELTKEEADVLKNKGVTGLDAAWSVPGLRCFPNPSSGSFHLEFDVPERGDLNVDIHDAQGERVYHETITGFKGRYERTLDLNDRADGTYFLVLNQNGKSLARKLVKQ